MDAQPTAAAAVDFRTLALSVLVPSPTNPRKNFNTPDWPDFVANVKQHGVMTPILARPWPEGRAGGDPLTQFEIVAGERRWRGSNEAELTDINVIVRNLTDAEVLELQIIENLQRRDISELEEADGYRVMIDQHGYTVHDLAKRIKKSPAYIFARLKLCDLGAEGRKLAAEGILTYSVALLVARIPGEKLQQQAINDVCKTDWQGERMSARAAAQHIQDRYMLKLANAPFARGDDTLVPSAGTCFVCPKRTGNCPEVFPDVKSADVCTDPDCFSEKRQAHFAKQEAEAKEKGQKVITGAAAEKILPYMHSRENKEYIVLETENYANGKTETYAKQLKGSTIDTVLIERDGKLVKCARKDDVQEALEAKGLKAAFAPPKEADKYKEQQKAAQRKAALEVAYRHELCASIRGSVTAGLQAGQAPTTEDMRVIAHAFWKSLDHEAQKHVAALWVPEDRARGKDGKLDFHKRTHALEADIAGFSPNDLSVLMFDMALLPKCHVPSWINDMKTPAALLETAERWGVDAKGIRAELEAADKKKAKEKAAKAKAAEEKKAKAAKPEKTPAKAKTPAPAKLAKPSPPTKAAQAPKKDARAKKPTDAAAEDKARPVLKSELRDPSTPWPFPEPKGDAPEAAQAPGDNPAPGENQAADAASNPDEKALNSAGAAGGGNGPSAPAIQYRHPTIEGQTWTGRGRRPKWVQDYLDGGGSLDELKPRCEKTGDMFAAGQEAAA